MSEKISSELEYQTSVNNHSTTVYRNVYPQSASAITLGASPVGPTEFLISPVVFNLAKTQLQFNCNVVPTTNTKMVNLSANVASYISRITLYDSATNAVWGDISNFEKYGAMVIPASTPVDQFLTKPNSVSAGAGASAAAALTAAYLKPVEAISKVAAANDYTVDLDGAALNVTTNAYTGRRYFYGSAVANLGCMSFSVPLSDFKLTVFATNKQLYNPSNLVVQIYWNTLASIGNYSTASTDILTGAEAIASGTITQARLVLATEGNLNIVSQVIDTTMKSGLSLAIPYPTVTNQLVAAGTPSYSINLTKGYGDRILAILTAPFGTAAYATNIHAVGPTAGATLIQYNTTLNNIALKYPAGFDVTKSEHYTVANKIYLKDSAVQTLLEYNLQEFVHIDSFFGEKPLKDVDPHVLDGLDVGTQSSVWSFSGTCTTEYRYITTVIGQKILSIGSMGSSIA